jgi:hypothetical protein
MKRDSHCDGRRIKDRLNFIASGSLEWTHGFDAPKFFEERTNFIDAFSGATLIDR